MLRDPNEAQDIAQETFVRLWRNRANVAAKATPTWLYRTATRLAVDALRQQNRRHTVVIDDDVLSSPGGDAVPASRLAAVIELERIAAQTPKKELEVAILSRSDGMTHSEIATVLNTSERTVRRRLRSFDQRLARSAQTRRAS